MSPGPVSLLLCQLLPSAPSLLASSRLLLLCWLRLCYRKIRKVCSRHTHTRTQTHTDTHWVRSASPQFPWQVLPRSAPAQFRKHAEKQQVQVLFLFPQKSDKCSKDRFSIHVWWPRRANHEVQNTTHHKIHNKSKEHNTNTFLIYHCILVCHCFFLSIFFCFLIWSYVLAKILVYCRITIVWVHICQIALKMVFSCLPLWLALQGHHTCKVTTVFRV